MRTVRVTWKENEHAGKRDAVDFPTGCEIAHSESKTPLLGEKENIVGDKKEERGNVLQHFAVDRSSSHTPGLGNPWGKVKKTCF